MVSKSMFIAYLSLISLVSISESDQTGFTTDLIHRDSPQSPSYDPSLSPSQRIVNALKRSVNRAKRFRRSKHTPESDVFFSGGDYLMKYSVGTPAVPSLGVADTGSDIIWTQCKPCLECFNQSLPIFNPKLSKTYRKLRCNATQCYSLPESYCSNTNKNCLYSESYGDNSFTNGELATDTLVLASNGKKKVSVPKVMFGCGFKNGGIFSGSESGIVGLGGGKASLVRQLGSLAQGKFSYCLVPVTTGHVKSSKLHFGTKATVSGTRAVSTPLVKKFPETFYFLTLEGISVGKQKLDFSDSGHYEEGNIIIDSGTTLTVLPFEFYNKLENAVKSSIKLKQIEDPEKQLGLCFYARSNTRVQVPEITVHFKGADLKLKKDNIFARTSNVSLCLAARPTQDIGIYGNFAQANFLVGYDLHKKTVTFKPTDCGKS